MSFEDLSKEQKLQLYEEMYTGRLLELKIRWDIKEREVNGEKKSNIPTVALISLGEEAVSGGATFALNPKKDYLMAGHRCKTGLVHFGLTPLEDLANHMCKADSVMRGRDGNVHYAFVDRHIGKFISHMIAGWPAGAGMAEGMKYVYERLEPEKYKDQELPVVLCFCGDGASRQGTFHEVLNFAAVRNLPIGFIIDNNGIATDTEYDEQTAAKHISDIAPGYNIAREYIDNGNDVIAVYDAASRLIARARRVARQTDELKASGNERAPFILECRTFRISEHNETRPAQCVNLPDWGKWRARDPIDMYRNALLRLPTTSSLRSRDPNKMFQSQEMEILVDELKAIEAKVQREVDEAYDKAAALKDPEPDDTLLHIFPSEIVIPQVRQVEPFAAGFTQTFKQTTDAKNVMSCAEALRRILQEEMRANKKIRIFGEDVGGRVIDGKRVGGGVYGITKDIIKDPDILPEQMFNTPLAETAILGALIGQALAGLIPIAEIQYFPFLSVALSQVIDYLPTWFWTAGIPVHAILRLPCGGGTSSGEFHSSMRLENILFHTPGLKMVHPSTPNDMYGLMKSAIHDDSPILFFENLWALSRISGSVSGEAVPVGLAALRAEGKDLTIIAWGAKTWFDAVLPAVRTSGISAELIDLRTLSPLDMDLMVRSVKKTHRALIAHEDITYGGVGQNIAQMLQKETFGDLLAPVSVVGSEYCLVPQHPNLERWFLPSPEKVLKAIHELMEWR